MALLLAATLFVGYTISNTAFATHLPADKFAVAGSNAEVIGANDAKVLLREEMKVATPTDLILQVTAECSILTKVANSGNGVSEAHGQVAMEITIDGNPVPVQDSTPGTPQGDDDGAVVFCDRLHRQTTGNFDDDDADDEIEQYLATRTANAFNWISINPAQYDENGDNVLDIKLIGHFFTDTTQDPPAGPAMAEAIVGNRTLVVEPVKLTVDEHTAPTGEGSPSPAPAPSCSGNGNGNGGCKP